MADSGIFHVNQDFISSDLIEHDGGELEVLARLRDDEGLGLDICGRHVVGCVLFSSFSSQNQLHKNNTRYRRGEEAFAEGLRAVLTTEGP